MSEIKKSNSVMRVEKVLLDIGILGEIRQLNQAARTAKEAADSLEVSLGEIVKTLLFSFGEDGSKTPVLGLIAGDRTCNINELKNELNCQGAYIRLNADEVKAITGFTIGCVSPVGLPTSIPIAIDESLFRFEIVWCAAGHPFFVFPISPKNLAFITNGKLSSKIGAK